MVLVVDDEAARARLDRGEQLRVIDDALVLRDGGVGPVVDDDEAAHVRHLVRERRQLPEQRAVDEDHVVVGGFTM